MIQKNHKIILLFILFLIYSCNNSEQKTLSSKTRIINSTTANMALIPEGMFQTCLYGRHLNKSRAKVFRRCF